MRKLRQRLQSECGFALVLALGITVVLGMTVVTVVEATTANSRAAVQSKNRVTAYDVAEAGINDAVSILAKAPSAYDAHTLHPQAPNQPSDCANPPPNPSSALPLGNTCNPIVLSYDGGTATFSGTYDSGTQNWTVSSTGQVRNPYGGQPATRTLTALIHVRPQISQQNVTTAWNYIFIRDTTPGICNVTLVNTAAISSSFYIEGNLCFKNQGDITETNANDPVSLEVRNMVVWLNGSTKGIGDAGVNPTQKISSAKIANGCASGTTDNAGNLTVTSGPHTCSPPGDYFYVKTAADCSGCGYSTSAPAITAPTLTSSDWDNYYANAPISRAQLGTSSCGTLSGASFDNNTTRDNSLPTFNLTPSTNYTCQTKDWAGSVTGELDWDATNHLLTVRGDVFIDGNVSISGLVKYRGVNYQGVHLTDGSDGSGGVMAMYVSGMVSLSTSGVFCGWNTNNDTAAYNSGTNSCDFSAWTPGKSMFMFVAQGGVTLNQGSFFQGSIFTPGVVSVGQSSQTEGPIIAGTMSIGQSAQMKPLPALADLPLGAPGNPNTSGLPDPPSYTGG